MGLDRKVKKTEKNFLNDNNYKKGVELVFAMGSDNPESQPAEKEQGRSLREAERWMEVEKNELPCRLPAVSSNLK